MQGADIDRAGHWLSVAGSNNLIRLAAKAERFLVQAAARLSGSPEADNIPTSSLLKMLDSRHAAIVGMQEIARTNAALCQGANMKCSTYGHPVNVPNSVKDALTRLRALAPNYSCVKVD